jgi:hypothetical protein
MAIANIYLDPAEVQRRRPQHGDEGVEQLAKNSGRRPRGAGAISRRRGVPAGRRGSRGALLPEPAHVDPEARDDARGGEALRHAAARVSTSGEDGLFERVDQPDLVDAGRAVAGQILADVSPGPSLSL